MAKTIPNYFRATKQHPYHLSMGAVLINEQDLIAFHRQTHEGGTFHYTLMRETYEPGETIEQTLTRGLMEEFGAKGRLVAYLGSIVSSFKIGNIRIQKTTLYHLMRLEAIKSLGVF